MVRRVHAIAGKKFKNPEVGTSLAVQYLRLHASTVRGINSIPGQGTKILQGIRKTKKKKKKKKKTRPFGKHEGACF